MLIMHTSGQQRNPGGRGPQGHTCAGGGTRQELSLQTSCLRLCLYHLVYLDLFFSPSPVRWPSENIITEIMSKKSGASNPFKIVPGIRQALSTLN